MTVKPACGTSTHLFIGCGLGTIVVLMSRIFLRAVWGLAGIAFSVVAWYAGFVWLVWAVGLWQLLVCAQEVEANIPPRQYQPIQC